MVARKTFSAGASTSAITPPLPHKEEQPGIDHVSLPASPEEPFLSHSSIKTAAHALIETLQEDPRIYQIENADYGAGEEGVWTAHIPIHGQVNPITSAACRALEKAIKDICRASPRATPITSINTAYIEDAQESSAYSGSILWVMFHDATSDTDIREFLTANTHALRLRVDHHINAEYAHMRQ